MEILKQNDSFIGGTEKQYQQITKLLGLEKKNHVINDSVIRGGLFWSEKLKQVVPGKLSNSDKYTFQQFIVKLKNTIDYGERCKKNS